jgi:hypothetical protein
MLHNLTADPSALPAFVAPDEHPLRQAGDETDRLRPAKGIAIGLLVGGAAWAGFVHLVRTIF